MSETAATPILSTRDGAVLTLRLNRPDKKNALLQAMYASLAESLTAAATDPSVRVVVIAAAATASGVCPTKSLIVCSGR